MKKFKFAALVLSVLGLGLTACSKEDNPTPNELGTFLQSSTWKITHFTDDGVDKTNGYSGYSFAFSADNVLTATKSGVTATGAYYTSADGKQTELVLDLGESGVWDALSEDWDVQTKSDTKLSLDDESGKGGKDLLTLEKE